jgi:hypothetical protein
VFENKRPRKIFGPKRYRITGEGGTLNNREIYGMYSPNLIRVIKPRTMKWMSDVVRVLGEERCVQFFYGEMFGKRTRGRFRRKWENNVRMVLLEVE